MQAIISGQLTSVMLNRVSVQKCGEDHGVGPIKTEYFWVQEAVTRTNKRHNKTVIVVGFFYKYHFVAISRHEYSILSLK